MKGKTGKVQFVEKASYSIQLLKHIDAGSDSVLFVQHLLFFKGTIKVRYCMQIVINIYMFNLIFILFQLNVVLY